MSSPTRFLQVFFLLTGGPLPGTLTPYTLPSASLTSPVLTLPNYLSLLILRVKLHSLTLHLLAITAVHLTALQVIPTIYLPILLSPYPPDLSELTPLLPIFVEILYKCHILCFASALQWGCSIHDTVISLHFLHAASTFLTVLFTPTSLSKISHK